MGGPPQPFGVVVNGTASEVATLLNTSEHRTVRLERKDGGEDTAIWVNSDNVLWVHD